MKIISIDPGTHNFGLAFQNLETNEVITETVIALDNLMGRKKLLDLARRAADFVDKLDADVLVLEDYAIGGNHFNYFVPEIVGMFFAFLNIDTDKKQVFMLAPNTVKKIVTGNGKATKAEVKNSVKELYSGGKVSVHAYDALAILESMKRYFEKTLEPKTMLMIKQRRIV